jgi:hypothetical protein
MTFGIVYVVVGALLFSLSPEIADGLNRFSVRVYDFFPSLKKLPFSSNAGSELNYKSSFYFFRILGILMCVFGALALGSVLLHRK